MEAVMHYLIDIIIHHSLIKSDKRMTFQLDGVIGEINEPHEITGIRGNFIIFRKSNPINVIKIYNKNETKIFEARLNDGFKGLLIDLSKNLKTCEKLFRFDYLNHKINGLIENNTISFSIGYC